MGTWSQEFINVSLFTAATPHLAIRTLVEHDLLLDEGERAPKVLYFARRADGSVWWVTEENETLVLPEHITVMIAPGAMISPLGAVGRLVIRGELQAPVGPIFPSVASPPPGVAREHLGQVDLLGPRLEYVHPEWWGGGVGNGAAVDSQAIEEALRVATRRASLVGAPAVIELLGRYQLSRPLRLFHEAPLGAPYGVELRGRLAGEDDATLSGANDFVGEALLDLGPYEGRLLCGGVRFDGRFNVLTCVRVTAQTARDGDAALHLPHAFTRCAFRGGVEAELQVFDASSFPASALGPYPLEVTPIVDFNGCTFRAATPPDLPRTPLPYPNVGARLLGPRGAGTRFFNCCFVGDAAAMIHATDHDVVVTGCRFDNTLIPARLRGSAAVPWRDLHKDGPAGGVDLFLGGLFRRPQPEVPKQARTISVRSEGSPPVSSPQAGVESRVVFFRVLDPITPPAPPPPAPRVATVTAQDCRSTSPQFLVAVRGGDGVRDSTVIGLHHAFEQGSIAGPLLLPPAILWLARDGVPTGPSLQLIGCRIDRTVLSVTPRVFAPDGGDDQPTVFDYGTSSDREQLATPVGHGAERYPGAFSPTAVGYVPFRR